MGKVKVKDKRSNGGSNHLTNDSKDEICGAHFLKKLDLNNEASQEDDIGTGDNMKKGDTCKKSDNLMPLNKTSNDTNVKCGSHFKLSKDRNYESNEHMKVDEAAGKSSWHNKSEKLTSLANFCDEEISLLDNRDIVEGANESRKHEVMPRKEKKKGKRNQISEFSSLKNVFAGGIDLEDEIAHEGCMGSGNNKKQMKRKGNYKENENLTTCTDNCNRDQDKGQYKKRRRRDCFLELEQGQGNLKESSGKEFRVSSEGDDDDVPSSAQIGIKKKKRVKENEELTKEKGDIKSTAAANHAENNKSDISNHNGVKVSSINESNNCQTKKGRKKDKKKVSFSNEVEEFPHGPFSLEDLDSDNMVWGKRYTPEEDEMIRKAVMNYIEVNRLGEQGLHMILNCSKYKQVRGCWAAIAAALPWRPRCNTYGRAHVIFERSEERKWLPEELELLKRYYAEHGPKWKTLADILGKSRVHVKDAWRRIRLPDQKKGKWNQGEYQSLFDLVNFDLRIKSFEEKKNKHSILKDNISWEAISDKMTTRGAQSCCSKWYFQLVSSLIQEGKWSNLDDYKLIEALQKIDACCIEDVEWDNLLAHRSGELCLKRWHEMIRHLNKFWMMTFIDQVDVLSQRYCPEMIPYRENI